jgi:hypothetical protein
MRRIGAAVLTVLAAAVGLTDRRGPHAATALWLPRCAAIGARRSAQPAANPTSCQNGRPGRAALISQ